MAHLEWEAQYDDLDQIVSSQLAWDRHLLEHPELLDND